METQAATAILLGANDRAMFSMARQLLKKNFRVEVADWEPLPLARSRFIQQYHRLSDGTRDVSRFVQELLAVLDAKQYALLIPINDQALELCVNFGDALRQRVTIVGLPSPAHYQYSHDKARLLEKCAEIGVPAPASQVVRKLADLDSLPHDLKFPLILKPAYTSLLKHNHVYTFTVKRVENRVQMLDAIRELIQNCPVIIQELLAGYGAGFNFLARDGELLSFYAHERVHEPAGGGQSSYRKTIAPESYNLRAHSEKLIRAIGWDGLAMIEYRICHGRPYIMEINGRLWGSIELGIFAGVNIPWQLLEHSYEHKPLVEVGQARLVFARNLKMDLRSALEKTGAQRSPRPLLKWLWSLRSVFSSREIVEDHPLRDCFFEAAIYLGYLKKAWTRLKERLSRTKVLPPAAPPAFQRGQKIGFVCAGNICRSPFAEFYARRQTGACEFASFGFYPQEERLAPTYAVEAARSFGIDLREHRSKRLTAAAVAALDVLLVMDESNLQTLHREFPQAAPKTFYLDPQQELSDPYGKSREEFSAVYREITRAIDGLLGHLKTKESNRS